MAIVTHLSETITHSGETVVHDGGLGFTIGFSSGFGVFFDENVYFPDPSQIIVTGLTPTVAMGAGQPVAVSPAASTLDVTGFISTVDRGPLTVHPNKTIISLFGPVPIIDTGVGAEMAVERNIIITTFNRADTAFSITPSHEISALGAVNLIDPSLPKIWRGNSTNVNFVVNLGDAYPIGLIAFVNTNWTKDGTWRIRASNVQGNLLSAPDYDSGELSYWPAAPDETIYGHVNPIFIPPVPQNFRFWRIDIQDSFNSDGFLQAGRLVLAEIIEPDINPSYGLRLGSFDPSTVRRTQGGQFIARTQEKYLILEFELGFLSEVEALTKFFELEQLVGSTQDVFVVLYPDQQTRYHRTAVWGLLSQLEPFQIMAFDIWAKRFRIEERL